MQPYDRQGPIRFINSDRGSGVTFQLVKEPEWAELRPVRWILQLEIPMQARSARGDFPKFEQLLTTGE